MQDIFRHAKTTNYFFVYHQCIIAWNNLKLNFRTQISKSSIDITLSNFLSQFNAKKSIWMNQAAKHRDNDFNNSNFSNTANKSNRLNKSNRKRQNDFNQQFFVFDFQSSVFTYWSSSNYNFYQYKYSAYQNQSNYQYRQLVANYQSKTFSQFASVLSIDKQSLLFQKLSEFDSKSKSNKSSDKKFSKFDKEKTYNVDDSDNEKHDFQEQNDEVENYHVSKNIFYYQPFFYNDSKKKTTTRFISLHRKLCRRSRSVVENIISATSLKTSYMNISEQNVMTKSLSLWQQRFSRLKTSIHVYQNSNRLISSWLREILTENSKTSTTINRLSLTSKIKNRLMNRLKNRQPLLTYRS